MFRDSQKVCGCKQPVHVLARASDGVIDLPQVQGNGQVLSKEGKARWCQSSDCASDDSRCDGRYFGDRVRILLLI